MQNTAMLQARTRATPFGRVRLQALACAVALATTGMLTGCGGNDAATAAANPPPTAPILQANQLRFPPNHPQLAMLTSVPAKDAQSVTVELPARFVWNEERTQRVYPAFAGRVTAIKADVGQPVKAGALLAQLASPDFGQAQADTAKAGVDLNLAKKSLQRQRELFEAGIIAKKDLEQSEADAARAGAEVARAAARTSLYGGGGGVNQQLGLLAGVNGVVVERNLNPGQEVRPDQSGPGVPALFVVTDPTSLWVQIDAKEADIGNLRPGASFTLQVPAYPNETFTGRVTAASDFIDPTTRTIKIRGVVDNADRRLKAEMLATARVQQSYAGGVIVPAAAVTLNGTQHTVFVQSQPGVFEPRNVRLSFEGPKQVVIASGIKPGEQIVADNALLLARQFSVAREDAGAPSTVTGQTDAVARANASASTSTPVAKSEAATITTAAR